MSLLLAAVLAAALMPVACAGIAKWGGFGVPRREGGFDNRAPREWLARQTGLRARANAAQANCFEALPFFVGAVAIALAAGVPAERLVMLAWIWVALRVVFVGCYLADRHWERSIVWTLAVALNVAILFSAA